MKESQTYDRKSIRTVTGKTAENGGVYLDLEVLRSVVSIASTTKGGYFIRDNDESKPIAPDELMRAISDKPSFSWETKVTSKIKVDQCDQEKLKKLIAKKSMRCRTACGVRRFPPTMRRW